MDRGRRDDSLSLINTQATTDVAAFSRKMQTSFHFSPKCMSVSTMMANRINEELRGRETDS